MRKFGAGLAAVLAAAGLGLVAPGPASAATYCGISWGGSMAKADLDWSSAHVTGVRTGQQPCYDRLVIDMTGKVAGFVVQYVPVVTQDATGYPIPVLGGDADLQVMVTARHTTSTASRPTNRQPRPNCPTFPGTRRSGRLFLRAVLRAPRASDWASGPGFRSGCSLWTDPTAGLAW